MKVAVCILTLQKIHEGVEHFELNRRRLEIKFLKSVFSRIYLYFLGYITLIITYIVHVHDTYHVNVLLTEV